jgi:hypothetical protein
MCVFGCVEVMSARLSGPAKWKDAQNARAARRRQHALHFRAPRSTLLSADRHFYESISTLIRRIKQLRSIHPGRAKPWRTN